MHEFSLDADTLMRLTETTKLPLDPSTPAFHPVTTGTDTSISMSLTCNNLN